jgi:hypothetical protein
MADSRPPVTIVGAGIAGMSAALRLLQAGRSVTVLERSARIGGQFGAIADGARQHEHAFHIVADWNQNLFALCRDIGLRHPPAYPGDPAAAFEPRPAFLTLEPLPRAQVASGPPGREASAFHRLEYLGAPQYFWRNACAGVAHWSDMAIYQYSILDLVASDDFDNEETKEFLNRVSVNGFMHSRPYASDIAALLHHELLLKVFAVPSYRTSARAYRTYLRHSAAFPPGRRTGPAPSDLSPSFWAMRGNVHDRFWVPFARALEGASEASGVRFALQRADVTSVVLAGDAARRRVTHVRVGESQEPHEVPGELLIAVPFEALRKILRNSPQLVAAAPELLDVASLESFPVPALNLYFRKDLGLPREHVTLLDAGDDVYRRDPSLARKNGIASRYGLSLIDHSQLWPELDRKRTVLSVLAADAAALMEEPSDAAIARRIVETLRQYIRFDDRDIELAHLQSHRDEPLFVNTVGSWQYRPEARLDHGPRRFPRVRDKVANLFLAGDYCRSEVDIVSLEAAVVTGVAAAHLIYDRVAPPIRPREPDRDRVRAAKALVDGWIGLATGRSHRHFLDRREEAERRLAGAEASPG